MTPTFTINLLRTLFVVFCLSVGSTVGAQVDLPLQGAAVGSAFGLIIVLIDRLLHGVSLRLFSSATVGALLGIVFAQLALSTGLFRYADEEVRWMIGLSFYLAFGYLGMMLAIRSNRDEFALVIPYVRFQRSGDEGSPILADTSAIIDGRIEGVAAAGFLTGSVIVPRFILDELQALSDSVDPRKREVGRRGLDSLKVLQSGRNLGISIHEAAKDTSTTIDNQLVELAKVLRAKILTNDTNLARVAQIQGVITLNLIELSKVLRPTIAPGDKLQIDLVKEGREADQAVGYLSDGSMVVVNNARAKMGKRVVAVVSGTMLTSGGRMIFADPTGEGSFD
jgi:uncharacterized protein YacL